MRAIAIVAICFALNISAHAETAGAPKIELDVKTWTRSTGIADIGFKISNSNEYAIKDPLIQCDFFGNSGTMIRRLEKVLYEKIPAHKSKYIRSFVMGISGDQAAKIGCAVVDFK